MKAPCLPHWEAVIQIVRYHKAHQGYGLLYKANGHLYKANGHLQVEAFTGVDWVATFKQKIHYWILRFSRSKPDYLEK